MFFNPLFLVFALPGLLLGLWAQARVRGTFNSYSKSRTMNGLTGAEVARHLLDSQGLQDVRIEEIQGNLSDHYDPRERILRLSPDVYRNPTVAAAGVAAHEMGHALQHDSGYSPLQIRSAIVPAVQFSSKLAPFIFMAGLLLGFTQLSWVGVGLFALAVLFSLVTLPVEIDASKRAKALLGKSGILTVDELGGVDKVLNAAALTYVAAAVAAIGQLMYFATLAGGGRRR